MNMKKSMAILLFFCILITGTGTSFASVSPLPSDDGSRTAAAASGDYRWTLAENSMLKETVHIAAVSTNVYEELVLNGLGPDIPGLPGVDDVTLNVTANGVQTDDNNKFKNAVLVNGVKNFNDELHAPNTGSNTLNIALDNSHLVRGENAVTFIIGNPNGYYDINTPAGTINHDDYDIKNISLTLSDGSMIEPSKIILYYAKAKGSTELVVKTEDYTRDKTYQLGDGFPAASRLDFAVKLDAVFDLSSSPLSTLFTVDTTQIPDGRYPVNLMASGNSVLSNTVLVDNTPPVIAASVKDGDELSGDVVLDAEIRDETSGVRSSTVKLDGVPIILPYTIAQSKTTASHELSITAADDAGNQTEQVIRFTTIATDSYNWNIKNGDLIKGIHRLSASSPEQGTDLTLKLDGTEVTGAPATGEFVLSFSGYGVEPASFNNAVLVNGAKHEGGVTVLADGLKTELTGEFGDGDNVLVLDADHLVDGTNSISLVCGVTGGGLFDESKPYGSENCDDFSVQDFLITQSDGTVVKPDSLTLYTGNNRSGVEASYLPGEPIKMGDGYPAGTSPSLAFKIVLTFHINKASGTLIGYSIDTTKLADGKHTLTLYANGSEIRKAEVTVDNTAPSIMPGVAEGQQFWGDFTLDASIEDAASGIRSKVVKLDGQAIELPYKLSSHDLPTGVHTLSITATDHIDNTASTVVSFVTSDARIRVADASTVPGSDGAALSVKAESSSGSALDISFKKAAFLNGITAYKNVIPGTVIEGKAPAGEIEFSDEDYANLKGGKDGSVASGVVNGLPYHVFEVDTSSIREGEITLSWTGETKEGEAAALYVWDKTGNTWVSVDSGRGSGIIHLQGSVEVSQYAENGKIRAMAAPDLHSNGSDTILWFTDTQFYTDSNYPEIVSGNFYAKITEYALEQYNKNAIAYVAHTGDLVNVKDKIDQWEIADQAQKVLDDAAVPNGVLSGNHDVGDKVSDPDYSLYHRYFGADRYNGKWWYGGQLNNNMHHYDLVTVDDHDFVVLYLGMSTEALPETIDWANKVLAKYADRNAVIAVHQYLTPGNQWLGYSRAEEIFNQIISVNKNVRMVICGHMPGVGRNIRTVQYPDGTTGEVIEILADYQTYNRGGDGFIRLMRFDGGKMETTTYSPATDSYNAYEAEKEEFVLEYPLLEPKRTIVTRSFSAALLTGDVIGKAEGVASGETAGVTWSEAGADAGWYAVITDNNGHTYSSNAFPIEAVDSPAAPMTPVEVRAVSDATRSATISWNPVSGAEGYRVYRSGTVDGTYSVVGTSTENIYNDTRLSAGSTYYYKISAYNGYGESEPSIAVSVKTRASYSGGSAGPIAPSNPGSYIQDEDINEEASEVSVDLSRGSTIMSASRMAELVKKNKEKAIMLSGADYSIAFAAGAMDEAAGTSNYDFGVAYNTGANYSKIVELSGDRFILMMNYNHKGALPGEAAIKIKVGAQHANKIVSYYSYNESGGKLEYAQSAIVDSNGYVTVNQDHNYDYVFVSALLDIESSNGLIDTTVVEGRAYSNTLIPYYTMNGKDLIATFSRTADGRIRFIGERDVEYRIKDNAKHFNDISGHWGEEAISAVAARELFLGTGGEAFSPEASMTRGMVVTVLGRLYKAEIGGSAAPRFSDTAAGQYYTPYIEWAAANGIVQGVGGDRFAPDAAVTREQWALIVANFVKFADFELQANRTNTEVWADDSAISSWARESVTEMQRAGLIEGKPGNLFDPQGEVTRAEIAVLLNRFIANIIQ